MKLQTALFAVWLSLVAAPPIVSGAWSVSPVYVDSAYSKKMNFDDFGTIIWYRIEFYSTFGYGQPSEVDWTEWDPLDGELNGVSEGTTEPDWLNCVYDGDPWYYKENRTSLCADVRTTVSVNALGWQLDWRLIPSYCVLIQPINGFTIFYNPIRVDPPGAGFEMLVPQTTLADMVSVWCQ